MYYEVDENNSKIRPLPGYFPGFKKDLKDVDPALLSDFQSDYLSIPDERIVEADSKEHEDFMFNAAQREKRAEAYRSEADPLFFKVQRGEEERAVYDAKVAEIRDRYKYAV